MTDVAIAFRDPDGPMKGSLVHCLDFMNDLPFFRTYKEHTWRSLGIGEAGRFLDIACGVGFDVAQMAKTFPRSEFVGIDKSRNFLDRARARAAPLPNASFVEGEADRLPFPDGAFAGARIDRSLQHLPDPTAAIAEMVRVTRSGGRIVASEPDWGTFVLYNGDRIAGDKMTEKWRQSIAHPFIGRELGLAFERSGAVDIGLCAHTLALTWLPEADVVFDLARLEKNCIASGVLTEPEAWDWRRMSEIASASGTFLACLTIVERWGTVRKAS